MQCECAGNNDLQGQFQFRCFSDSNGINLNHTSHFLDYRACCASTSRWRKARKPRARPKSLLSGPRQGVVDGAWYGVMMRLKLLENTF